MNRDYKPVGYCIYCGASDGPLSMEHIVPYGLGGTLELPKASCRRCQKETTRIENACLRTMLGDLRAWRKVKGRKHKDKYKPHKMLIETDDEKIEYAAESPDVRLDLTFMYAFEHPTILAGQPPLAIWVPKFEFMWIAMAMGKNAESHAKQFYPNPKRLTTSAAFNPTIFAKMIAKIGYSFAFAEALGRFEPLGGRAIVGLDPWFPNYLVGGEPDQAPKSEYQTETGLLRWPDVNGKEYLVARVRLFGEFGAPVYYAVVGEL